MPGVLSKHAQLIAENEAEYEGGGVVVMDTQNEKSRTMSMFRAYIISQIQNLVEELVLKDRKTEDVFIEDLAKLSKVFSKYFWTLRVDVMVRNLTL